MNYTFQIILLILLSIFLFIISYIFNLKSMPFVSNFFNGMASGISCSCIVFVVANYFKQKKAKKQIFFATTDNGITYYKQDETKTYTPLVQCTESLSDVK